MLQYLLFLAVCVFGAFMGYAFQHGQLTAARQALVECEASGYEENTGYFQKTDGHWAFVYEGKYICDVTRED